MATKPLADPDTERAARYMIELHGGDAELRARARAAELLRMGEHGAAAIWEGIAAAVHGLEPGEGSNPTARFAAPDREAMRDYQVTLIGTSGRGIAVEVMPSVDDDEAIRDARGLFDEYPKVIEIVVRRDGAFIARLERP